MYRFTSTDSQCMWYICLTHYRIIDTQKRPIDTQKRPIDTQKRPKHTQNMWYMGLTHYRDVAHSYILTHTHTHTQSSETLSTPSNTATRPQLKGSITVTLPDGTEVEVHPHFQNIVV